MSHQTQETARPPVPAADADPDRSVDSLWLEPQRARPREAAGPAERRLLTRLSRLLPALPVLAAQGYLAWRLIPVNSAFLDEATYLYAGHQEIGHLAHGAPAATYQTFFSGAPVLYPILAALVDTAGGLTGVRTLSLGFMLLATLAVYLIGSRMYGLLAGFFAGALFAALGPTLHLSSFATFDALALCLLAWSAYCVVLFAHGDRRDVLVYGAVLMVLADCVKYASLLWNPFILLLAGCAGPGYAAWKNSRSWNVQRFAMVSGVLIVFAVLLGRQSYFKGFLLTTLRQPAGATAAVIVGSTESWIGIVLGLGALGLLVVALGALTGRQDGAQLGTAALLLLAGLAAPLNQVRIHTLESLNKHVDFGAVFVTVLAGAFLAWVFGNARLPRRLRPVTVALAVGAAVLPVGWFGVAQARDLQDEWPDSAPMIAALRPLVHRGGEHYLVEDPYVAAYYLGNRVSYTQWDDTWSASFIDQATGRRLSGVPAFTAAVQAHHYAVIVLSYTDTAATDEKLAPAITAAGYLLVAKIPHHDVYGSGHFFVWTYPAGG